MIERTRNTKHETRNKINTMEKKIYNTPQIELIILDNEISLALESTPPAGPDESHVPENNQTNSFTNFA